MSLTRIGPVAVTFMDPSYSVESQPTARGHRAVSLGGQLQWDEAQQLSELVANQDRRITVGGVSGVLEYVHADDELLAPFRGWHLLTAFSIKAGHSHSLAGVTGPVPFDLSAVQLGDNVQVVVARSARARSNTHGLTPVAVVADPFRSDTSTGEPFTPPPAGGSLFTREHDPAPYGRQVIANTRSLVAYAGTMADGVDVLPPVVVPAPRDSSADPPLWLTEPGGDVEVYDRRRMQAVGGTGHSFQATTDLLANNGLLRFRVGNRGVIPYVAVEACRTGAWRDMGFIVFSMSTSDVLRGARLARLTADEATVVLFTRESGDISLTLRRDFRGIEVRHGADYPPYASVPRSIAWRGVPPAVTMSGVGISTTGKFGRGITVTDLIQFYWPEGQSNERWAWSGWWSPQSAAASQPDSCLLAIMSGASIVGRVEFVAATRRVRFTLGAASIEFPVLAFGATAPVFVGVDFDEDSGMSLTVSEAGTTTRVTGSSTDPGAASYSSWVIGRVFTPYGAEPYGSGPYGGSPLTAALNGAIENVLLFERALAAAEWTRLAGAAHRLDGLPKPEGHLVWYAPFAARPAPVGSAVTSGRRYESTAENGATRSPDVWGLTKAVASLEAVTAGLPFGITGTGEHLNALAYLATTDTQDDLADHHAQYAAASEQELRVR